MKSKKIIALILFSLVLLLSACGSSESSPEPTSSDFSGTSSGSDSSNDLAGAVLAGLQTTKWINTSKLATDCSNYNAVASAAIIALASDSIFNELSASGATYTITISTSGITITKDNKEVNSEDNFVKEIEATIGSDFSTAITKKTNDIPDMVIDVAATDINDRQACVKRTVDPNTYVQ